jgi:hypothetical protein
LPLLSTPPIKSDNAMPGKIPYEFPGVLHCDPIKRDNEIVQGKDKTPPHDPPHPGSAGIVPRVSFHPLLAAHCLARFLAKAG